MAASTIVFLSSILVPPVDDGAVALQQVPGGGTEAIAEEAAALDIPAIEVYDLTSSEASLVPPATVQGQIGELRATVAPDQIPVVATFGEERLRIPAGSQLQVSGLTGTLDLAEEDLSTVLELSGSADSITIHPPQAEEIRTIHGSEDSVPVHQLRIDDRLVEPTMRDAGSLGDITFTPVVSGESSGEVPSVSASSHLFPLTERVSVAIEDFVGVVAYVHVSEEYARLSLHGYGNASVGDQDVNVSEGADETVALNDVPVNQPPEANFSYAPLQPTAGETVRFTDDSEDDIAIRDRHWDFDDGATSNQQHPTHTFATAGSYDVTLNVTDVLGESSEETKTILVGQPLPELSISWSPFRPVEEQATSFAADVKPRGHTIQTIEWRFEDGRTLEGETVERSFPLEGTYNATVVLTTAEGEQTDEPLTVNVENAPPQPAFAIDPDPPTALETVTLTSTSQDVADGEIVRTEWNIEGLDQKTGEEINVTFPQDGPTTVKLLVEDDDGDSSVLEATIQVQNPPPEVSIRMDPAYPNPEQSVDFVADVTDDDNPAQAHWLFSDGPETDSLTTTRSFEAGGEYQVDLEVEDTDGATGSATRTFQVNHAPEPAINVRNEDPDIEETAVFTGEILTLDGNVTDADLNDTTHTWVVDGQRIDAAQEDNCDPVDEDTITCSWPDDGDHTVRLRATDENGATGVDRVDVLVVNRPPTLDPKVLSSGINLGETVSFAANADDPDGQVEEIVWFIEGDEVGTGQQLEHTFQTSGQSDIRVQATDDDGATENATFTVDVNAPPVLDASVTPTEAEAGDTIQFSASATDPDGEDTAVSFLWETGDGTELSGSDPGYAYRSGGTYIARVTATDEAGGTTSRSFTLTIETPSLDAAVSWSPTPPIEGEGTRLRVDLPSDRWVEEIEWTFGDGQTQTTGANVTEVTHTYDDPKTYDLKVVVHADHGSTDTNQLPLRVAADVAHTMTFRPLFPDGRCLNLDHESVDFYAENLVTGQRIGLSQWTVQNQCTLNQAFGAGEWSLGEQGLVVAQVGDDVTSSTFTFNNGHHVQDLDFRMHQVDLNLSEILLTPGVEDDRVSPTYQDPSRMVRVFGNLSWFEGTPVDDHDLSLTVTYRDPLDLVPGLGGSGITYVVDKRSTGPDGSFDLNIPAPVLAADGGLEPADGGPSEAFLPGQYTLRIQATSGIHVTAKSADFIMDPEGIIQSLRDAGQIDPPSEDG